MIKFIGIINLLIGIIIIIDGVLSILLAFEPRLIFQIGRLIRIFLGIFLVICSIILLL